MAKEQCSNCRYFLQSEEAPTEGLCRRFPPVPIIVTDVKMIPGRDGPTPQTSQRQMSFFPLMSSEDGYCGEWTLRKDVH